MSVLNTSISNWTIVSDVLSSDGAATDLSVSQRTYLTAQAAIVANANNQDQISIHRLAKAPTSPTNALRFRCRGITADSVCTYNIYTGTLSENPNCELSLLGILSFIVGTQGSIVATYEMADQLTVTDGDTSESFTGTTSAADNRVAETTIDAQGSDLLVVVPTAVGSNCQLLIKPW